MRMKIRFLNKFTFIVVLFMITQQLQAQWVKQNSGTLERLTDVVMLDSSTAIAVGMNQTILKTTNSGETWNFVPLPWSFPMNWKSISFADKLNGVIAGSNVITTTDGGETWKLEFYSYDKNFLSALSIYPGYIYAGDDSGYVYHSIDTGKTWSSEKISAYPIRSIFAYLGPNMSDLPLYALTSHSIIRKNDFYISAPWNEKELSFFNGLGSEAYRGELCNGTFIVGVQGDLRAAPVILRSSISEIGWTQANLYPDPGGELLGVSAPSSSVIYACGSSGLMYKTTDGGDNWILHSVPTTQTLHSINFFNDTRGFAVGDSGTILFTSNGGLTDIADGQMPMPNNFVLSQNYPNPFNPSTRIQYSVASSQNVTLKVFDVLGNEVAMLVNELKGPGVYTIQFEGGDLTSGVYFYKLQSGSFVQTKKFVLMK